MPTGTTENIDCFKNAPSDATHYVCVGGRYRYLKESHHPNGDVFVIENWGKEWLPDSHICGTIGEYIERQSRNNTRILASRSLKEEQDSVWEYLKGSEKDFDGAPEGTNIIADYKPPLFYKLEGETLEYYDSYSTWEDSIESFYFVGDKGYNTSLPILAVRRKVKKTEPTNKVIKVDCVIKSTPTEDKTVQEFQNGQEVLWHKEKAFYVGESKEKGKSIIEIPMNHNIEDTTYNLVTTVTSSLSPVKQKAAASDVDSSASVGNAVIDYFIKTGAFPKTNEETHNVTSANFTQEDLKALKEHELFKYALEDATHLLKVNGDLIYAKDWNGKAYVQHQGKWKVVVLNGVSFLDLSTGNMVETIAVRDKQEETSKTQKDLKQFKELLDPEGLILGLISYLNSKG